MMRWVRRWVPLVTIVALLAVPFCHGDRFLIVPDGWECDGARQEDGQRMAPAYHCDFMCPHPVSVPCADGGALSIATELTHRQHQCMVLLTPRAHLCMQQGDHHAHLNSPSSPLQLLVYPTPGAANTSSPAHKQQHGDQQQIPCDPAMPGSCQGQQPPMHGQGAPAQPQHNIIGGDVHDDDKGGDTSGRAKGGKGGDTVGDGDGEVEDEGAACLMRLHEAAELRAGLPRPLRSGDWRGYVGDLSARLVCDCAALFQDQWVLHQVLTFAPDLVLFDSQMLCATYLADLLGVSKAALVTSLRPPTEQLFFDIPEPVGDVPMYESGLPRSMTALQAIHDAGNAWSLDAVLHQLQSDLDRQVAWRIIERKVLPAAASNPLLAAALARSAVTGRLDGIPHPLRPAGGADGRAAGDRHGSGGATAAGTGSSAANAAGAGSSGASAAGAGSGAVAVEPGAVGGSGEALEMRGLVDSLRDTALVVIAADPAVQSVPPLLPQHVKVVSPIPTVSANVSGDIPSPLRQVQGATQTGQTPTGTLDPLSKVVGPSMSMSKVAGPSTLLVVINSAMARDPPRMHALAIAIARLALFHPHPRQPPAGSKTGPKASGGPSAPAAQPAAHGNGSGTGPAGAEAEPAAGVAGRAAGPAVAAPAGTLMPQLSVVLAVDEDSVTRVFSVGSWPALGGEAHAGQTATQSRSKAHASPPPSRPDQSWQHMCGPCSVDEANSTLQANASQALVHGCVPPPLMGPMQQLAKELRSAGVEVQTLPQVLPHASLLARPGVQAVVMGCASSTWLTAARHAVPILCLPMQGDENDGAQRVMEAGIGQRVLHRHSHRWPRVEETLNLVLSDPTIRRHVEAVADLLRPGPCDGACQTADLLEHVLRRSVPLHTLHLTPSHTTGWSHRLAIILTGCLTLVVLTSLGACMWLNTQPISVPRQATSRRPNRAPPSTRQQQVAMTEQPRSWYSMLPGAMCGSSGAAPEGEVQPDGPPASPSKLKKAPHKKVPSWPGTACSNPI